MTEPREDTSESSNPSGVVPLEPQEEKLSGEQIEAFVRLMRGPLEAQGVPTHEEGWRILARNHLGYARRALSAVPLLQDGNDDV